MATLELLQQHGVRCAVKMHEPSWLIGLVLSAVVSSATITVLAEQPETVPPYIAALQTHLAEARVSPGTIQVVAEHLKRTNPGDPFQAVVDWGKKERSVFVQLGIVHAIHFFLQPLPEVDRAKKYLWAMDALCQGDGTDYYTWQLAASARTLMSPSVLQREALSRNYAVGVHFSG